MAMASGDAGNVDAASVVSGTVLALRPANRTRQFVSFFCLVKLKAFVTAPGPRRGPRPAPRRQSRRGQTLRIRRSRYTGSRDQGLVLS